MRFSDWSSDVVSSDLHAQHPMPAVRLISRKTIVPRRTGGIAARTMSRNPKSPSSAIAASIRDRSIVLVGLMGSGKSTIGRRLAQRLGMRFADAEDEIEIGRAHV